MERLAVLQALGMGKGHWFRCPNGHIYAIGDCGGAMEISKCNECGAAIGKIAILGLMSYYLCISYLMNRIFFRGFKSCTPRQ